VFAAALVVGVGWVAAHRGALVQVLFARIDPRPMAIFRIGFGLCLLALLWETAPLAEYLFSDEGLRRRAEPSSGWWRYVVDGRWSLLHVYDAPWFVHGYLVVLALASVALTIGWHTRAATIAAWLLFAGLLRRGDAHWGGEQIVTGLLFVSMFADSGAAYSVDAWRRSSAVGPRRISVWPQALLVLQLVVAYAANGWAKTGPTWVSGDTLGLAMQLDRYARVDWQWLIAIVGPGPLRVATWSVLWWERLFPLALVGLWWRACVALGVPTVGARVLRTRAAWLFDPRPWLGFGVLFHAIGVVLFEIGAFVGATVAAYVLFGVGPPWGTTRVDLEPPESRTPLPEWAWLGAIAVVVTVGVVGIATHTSVWWYGGWATIAIGLLVLGRSPGRSRIAAGLFVAHHTVSLVLWQSPSSPWRDAARGMVEPWMERTYTRQLWSMFAPNGPTRNQTVRTTVIVGEAHHDLRTELEHDLRRPYLLHDRWRKVDEGVSGYRRGLAEWHARWVCRRWVLDHGGEIPDRVVLERVVAPFAPADVVDREAWFWTHAEVEPIAEVVCADDPFGVPSAEILSRHGISTFRSPR
jgi:hypothetical protein